MMLSLLLATAVAVQAAPEPPKEPEGPPPAEAQAEAATTEADDPKIEVVEEKPKKITDRNHPDYIRCRSEPIIGSRAKRKRTCMTNREWANVSRKGNKGSREFVEDLQPGFQPGSS